MWFSKRKLLCVYRIFYKINPISILKRHFSLLSHVAKHMFIVTLAFSVVIVQTSTSPWCVCVLVGQVRPTLYHPGAVAHQAPLSLEFSRQEYWSELPFPSPGDIPHPGIEPRSPALQADSLPSEPPWMPLTHSICSLNISFLPLFLLNFRSQYYSAVGSCGRKTWFVPVDISASPWGAAAVSGTTSLPTRPHIKRTFLSRPCSLMAMGALW